MDRHQPLSIPTHPHVQGKQHKITGAQTDRAPCVWACVLGIWGHDESQIFLHLLFSGSNSYFLIFADPNCKEDSAHLVRLGNNLRFSKWRQQVDASVFRGTVVSRFADFCGA